MHHEYNESCCTLKILHYLIMLSLLGVSRQVAQQWCIKYGFELVELDPEDLPDEEGLFANQNGYY